MNFQMTKVGEICQLKYGSSLPERSRESGNVPVYGSNGIVGFHNKSVTNGPTLIVGRKGSAGKIQFSDVGCFPIDTTYYVDETLKECNLKWLFYCLSFNDLSRYNKAAAVPGINRNDVYDLAVPFPGLKEQNEIADVLEQADKARQQRQAANALTDQFLQSSFLSLFGDPGRNEKGWEAMTLEDVCDKITDGTHHSPVNLEAGDYKYITAKNIKEEGILMSNISYVTAEAHKAIYSRCNPEFEDVLYIKDGVTTGIAVVNHLKEEFSMLSSVALLKCNRKKLSPYFLASYLNNDSVYDGIRKNMGGAAITRVTLQKINAIKIILPPLSLQQEFAGIVAQAEQLRQKQRESERELENLFQGLLQRYFG